MMALTVRQKVLQYLAKRPDATASQIGHALGIAAASVRYHLALLRRDGRIVVVGARSSNLRGRPTRVYRLSERLRGDNLAALADTLLGIVLKGPRGTDDAVMSELVKGLLAQLGTPEPGGPGPRRLASLIDKLNALHYEASWEAGSAGPRVLFGHCPYAAIIEKHPELCQMDSQMLGLALGVSATQTAKIDPRLGGQAHCIFVLK